MQKSVKKAKVTGSMLAIFGVASVLFSSHAGGGFATGNQETQYYVQYGWTAPNIVKTRSTTPIINTATK